jgi:hypothetical protein
VPDRSTPKGKRDYVILALLVGCVPAAERAGRVLRRDHPAAGRRWVLADLEGKAGASAPSTPIWVKQGTQRL